MPLTKVKDVPNLARDEDSKAIINTDNRGYADYVSSRDRLKKQQDMLLTNTKEINNLKEDMQEIKALLLSLASKIEGKV
jgi:hypothetical protein